MSVKELVIQMKTALELQNDELKALAKSDKSGSWVAEYTLEYQVALEAVKAADAYLQGKPFNKTSGVPFSMLD